MQAIIFWHVAEYADYSSKLTIKLKGKRVRQELWSSGTQLGAGIHVETHKYGSKKEAYRAYRDDIAGAILGGWQVLNTTPKRETWETRRSK